MSNDDPELVRIAEAVSDGLPVDWEAESPAPARDRPIVEQLRALERVVEAHRDRAPGWTAESEAPAAGGPSGAPEGLGVAVGPPGVGDHKPGPPGKALETVSAAPSEARKFQICVATDAPSVTPSLLAVLSATAANEMARAASSAA